MLVRLDADRVQVQMPRETDVMSAIELPVAARRNSSCRQVSGIVSREPRHEVYAR